MAKCSCQGIRIKRLEKELVVCLARWQEMASGGAGGTLATVPSTTDKTADGHGLSPAFMHNLDMCRQKDAKALSLKIEKINYTKERLRHHLTQKDNQVSTKATHEACKHPSTSKPSTPHHARVRPGDTPTVHDMYAR